MKKNRTVLEAKRLEVYACSAETRLRQAAEQMTQCEISALVVVDAENDLQGIITRTDLIRAHLERDDWGAQPVADYMTHDVVVVTPQALLSDVARRLLEQHIHRVVVVRTEGGRRRPVAVVSASDLVYHMLRD
jgi:CBS domain-containing protein